MLRIIFAAWEFIFPIVKCIDWRNFSFLFEFKWCQHWNVANHWCQSDQCETDRSIFELFYLPLNYFIIYPKIGFENYQYMTSKFVLLQFEFEFQGICTRSEVLARSHLWKHKFGRWLWKPWLLIRFPSSLCCIAFRVPSPGFRFLPSKTLWNG